MATKDIMLKVERAKMRYLRDHPDMSEKDIQRIMYRNAVKHNPKWSKYKE